MKRLSVTYHQQKPKPPSRQKSQRVPSRASSVKSPPQQYTDFSYRQSLKPKPKQPNPPPRPSSIKKALPMTKPTKQSTPNNPPKQSYKDQFMDIVEKVFKRVDFLNEKYIDVFSIQKCVDQKILYFFGAIFHRIKTKNLRMGKYQFMVHAEKVFQKSSLLDIRDLIKWVGQVMFVEEVKQEPVVKETLHFGGLHQKQVKDEETSKIVMRGEAAINQAMAHRKKLPPSQIEKEFDFSKIELDLYSKQKTTPLFQGNSNIGLMDLDLNRPFPNRFTVPDSTKQFSGRIIKQSQTDSDLKHSAENQTRPAEEDSQAPWKNPKKDKQNRNFLSDSRKRIEQSKLIKLQDRIDYFIQKNSEHLHVSQCIRLQNGF